MSHRILIVGGVAAGASAATKARRTDEHAQIVLFERGEYVSFANCGLPYYVSRQIKRRESLLVVKPEQFRLRHNIDVRLRHEVVSIDREDHSVTVQNLVTGESTVEPYDSLVLTPGARPIVPPMPMADAPNVFLMRTIPDMDRIDAYIGQHETSDAVVIGAGYIGIEMAEALAERGLTVHVVERMNQVIPPLDPDMTQFMEDYIRQSGVDLALGDGVAELAGDGEVDRVVLESGRDIPTDLVVMAIGVRPNVDLATGAGLEIGSTGAIRVDSGLKTADPHIYAAGDAAETLCKVTGRPAWYPLAGLANKQGRVAGANAAGGAMRFGGATGTAIVRFGEKVCAATGLNESKAALAGFEFETAVIHTAHHATYYPGASSISVKLVYERHGGRLLGAQVVGGDGVDKRIDVLATALAGRMTVDDVAELDLAYAPPFGSARDPLVVAGSVAQNQISGNVNSITAEELHEALKSDSDIQLIDVRTAAEYSSRYIPESTPIPIDELRDRIGEIDIARPTVVCCGSGLRSYLACRILDAHGCHARNLSGGMQSWRF
jgi:NADPH-dependent 2,4-dienoyl-CoA reductase/sulfur reductase-like enzyme/rhodanese-related sulfurtransferase